jgi:hypothetical protein
VSDEYNVLFSLSRVALNDLKMTSFDVFISYPHQDKTTADAACATLEAAGIRCWIAPRDIPPGREWSECIIDAISGSKVMVLVFSGHSNASPQIKREVERAVNKGIPIIPLRIEDVLPSKALEYFISTPHWLDALTPPIERHLKKLVLSVKGLLEAGPSDTFMSLPRPASRRSPRNLLEWLSMWGAPDSLRAPILMGFVFLTLMPYLGGTTVWSFGATPLSVPTVPAAAFWYLVFFTPIWWCILTARLIGASVVRIAVYLAGALALSCLSIFIHMTFPGIALGAITPNFDQTFQIGFLETQHSWIASHERDRDGERYCHFRIPPKDLGPPVGRGCTLRVDRLAMDAGGYAAIPELSAFDVELYLGSNPMLSETTECVPAGNWQTVRDHPEGAEVELRAVVGVTRTALGAGGAVSYSVAYDYENRTWAVSPQPAAGMVPAVARRDIPVRGGGTRLQMSGWTLWGDPSRFQLDVINLHVRGRLFCGL